MHIYSSLHLLHNIECLAEFDKRDISGKARTQKSNHHELDKEEGYRH